MFVDCGKPECGRVALSLQNVWPKLCGDWAAAVKAVRTRQVRGTAVCKGTWEEETFRGT